MPTNRRHLYIPGDLWSRLTSEAGTVGVRERGRAYSASEYACKLIASGMDSPRHRWEWDEQSTRTDAQPNGQEESCDAPNVTSRSARSIVPPLSATPSSTDERGEEGQDLKCTSPNNVARARRAKAEDAGSIACTSPPQNGKSPHLCHRQGCTMPKRMVGRTLSDYCSASHRLADEQRRAAYG